jgi:hypothetical protein
MDVSGQLHDPVALPPEQEPSRCLLDRTLGGPQNRPGRCVKEKILLLPEFEPQLIAVPARLCSLAAVK